MKPNDKAIEALADVLQHHGVFHGWFPKGLPADWRQLDPIGRREFFDIAGRLADAAFAAQFPPSEDYAGLVKELRDAVDCHQCDETGEKAADALEELLAERDAMKDLYAATDWMDKIKSFTCSFMCIPVSAVKEDEKFQITLTGAEIRALIDARRKARGE